MNFDVFEISAAVGPLVLNPKIRDRFARRTSAGVMRLCGRAWMLGFNVVVTEPTVGPVRPLELFADYSRREVHDIFAPTDSFSPVPAAGGYRGSSNISRAISSCL
ncbi:MAG: hypothetical protein AUH43_24180 [Acidobacteria bacterium 13_1_40CM_65_14]|nr:MAG: hypothetical protein AUH43_24180 [Acidobacteria bacterium 13_1_40CM_65_14]OLE78434.1 MAG: hypothetical protein AUF76_19150 [Acidobacteria bacterium 13_1_20CM_2_65_9]